MSDERSNNSKILTVKETAAILRVHPYTIYDLLKTGRLVGFKIRHSWRVVEASVTKFMSEKGKEA